MNFTETAEDPAAVHGQRLERLRAVRAVVDPQRVFVANHPID
jgi:FAD/FMN-containing dehydrogenase